MTDLIPRGVALKIYTDWTIEPEEAIFKLRAIPAIDHAAIREAALRDAVRAAMSVSIFKPSASQDEINTLVMVLAKVEKSILALATPDQSVALDRLIAEAVAPYKSVLKDIIDHADEISSPLIEAQLLLAASKKGGA